MKIIGLKKLLTLNRQWYKINLSPTKRKKTAVEFPIPATITEAPELAYDPYATIVYNASDSYYSGIKPETISADRITTIARSERNSTRRVATYETCVDKVRDYLVENYGELNEHADEIARLLNIDLSEEVEVTFDVTIKATISIPVGQTASDLSTYDFDVELVSNDSDYDVQDYDVDINSIDER